MHGLLLAIAVLAAPEPSASSISEEEAKRAFSEGKDAYDKGNIDLAIKDFELSYQLAKRGELLFAIARSYHDLGRWVESRDCYKKYLLDVPNGKSRVLALGELHEVEQKLEEVGQQLATIPTVCGASPSPIVAGLPGPVASVSAVSKNDAAYLTWTRADDKDNPVTGYTVKSIPPIGAGVLHVGRVTSAGFSGLSPGTSYVFSVAARNINGDGPSTVSNPVKAFVDTPLPIAEDQGRSAVPPEALVAPVKTGGSSDAWMPVAGWTGVAISAAAFVAGAVLLGVSAGERSAAQSDHSSAGTYSKSQTANAEQAAGIGTLIGGGVVLVPSVIFLLISHGESAQQQQQPESRATSF